MKPVSHHYVALTIAIVILCVSVAGYFFIDFQVVNQTKRTSTAFTKVASEEALAAEEKTLTQSLSATSDARALAETYLIPQDQTVLFIVQIENVSRQSGANVSLASISGDDLTSAPSGKIGHLQAHISINGSWTNAMRALHIIEDLPYSLAIDSVTARAGNDGTWNIDFNLATLIVK